MYCSKKGILIGLCLGFVGVSALAKPGVFCSHTVKMKDGNAIFMFACPDTAFVPDQNKYLQINSAHTVISSQSQQFHCEAGTWKAGWKSFHNPVFPGVENQTSVHGYTCSAATNSQASSQS